MTWTVEIYDGANWQDQNGVQNLDITVGRRFLTDPYAADRMTYSGLISTNFPELVVMGAPIRVRNGALERFEGRITNVSIDYGKVTNADRITVTAESLIAELGRTNLTSLNLSSTSIADQIDAIGVASGIALTAPYGSNSLAKTQTYTGNALELVNKLVATEFGYLRDIPNVGIEFVARNEYVGTTTILYSFSDDNPTGYVQAYDTLRFASLADNYWTAARVEPDGLAAQQTSSSATPPRILVVQTLDQNTTQANNLALYLKATFDQQAQTIVEISALDIEQSTNYLDDLAYQLYLGVILSVEFRSNTYLGVMEGFTISARPNSTRYTFYVSPQNLNDYLRLDSNDFGQLDQNRLGF